jgi:PhnB protein
MIEVSPVLTFRGNCEAAFEYYKSVFGGEYLFLYRYNDADAGSAPEGYEEKILHVSLPLMKNVYLMGSDVPGDATAGDLDEIVSIGVRLNSRDETFRIFGALSEGGRVIAPLEKAFYADLFGSLVDRFGVRWTFNCNIGRESEI